MMPYPHMADSVAKAPKCRVLIFRQMTKQVTIADRSRLQLATEVAPYSPENLCSGMQKDFFNGIGTKPSADCIEECPSLRAKQKTYMLVLSSSQFNPYATSARIRVAAAKPVSAPTRAII
jgi:hypothetical protein